MKAKIDYKSQTSHWNPSALHCYFRKGRCKGCSIVEGLESLTCFSCQMKWAVIELVKKYGRPTEDDMDKWSDYGGKHKNYDK